MRIALVSQEYPPETAHGGIATQTFAKANGLAALGHAVHVIAHSTTGARTEQRAGGVGVIRIPGYDAEMPIDTEAARWITWSVLVAAELRRLHAREPLDIVDSPEFGGEAYVHLLNRAAWSAIPTVIHLQGPMVMLMESIGWPLVDSELYRQGTAMESTCLRLADGIVSSSVCSALWVERRYGIAAASIPVIHAGIDTEAFRPGLSEPGARPTIVFVGRVAASKGADTLVAAATLVAAEIPDLCLRLIGRVDDSVRAQLDRVAAGAGHPRLLEFAGQRPRAELPRELCRAHVFAAPSRYEGGPGFVYLEAMACGLPVIGCSGSGAAETIRDGETGILVPPDDATALAGALRQLLVDERERVRLGAAARAYVVAEADTRACMRRYAGFLESVVERHR